MKEATVSISRITTLVRGHRRTATAVAAAVGLAACAAATLAALPSSASTPASAAPVVRHLRAIALRAAKADGDAAPTSILAVRTTHGQALRVATPGDHTPGGAATVYLIVMKGSFNLDHMSMPPEANAHAAGLRWPYLSLVVNARTLEATDVGIGPHAPRVPISSLGRVINLLK